MLKKVLRINPISKPLIETYNFKCMKRILLTVALIFLFGTVAYAQTNDQPNAWKIVFKTHLEPTPNAPQVVIKRTNKKNENLSSVRKIVLVSDSLWRITHRLKVTEGHKSKTSSIYSRRDSVVYQYDGSLPAYVRQSYASYLATIRKNMKLEVTNVQHYPKSEKVILGYPTQKFTFDLVPKKKSVELVMHCKIWYTRAIPHWHVNEGSPVKIPGYPLKKISYMEHKFTDPVRSISRAVSIERVPLEASDYFPADSAKIVNRNEIKETDYQMK